MQIHSGDGNFMLVMLQIFLCSLKNLVTIFSSDYCYLNVFSYNCLLLHGATIGSPICPLCYI